MKVYGVEVIDFLDLTFPKMKTMIYGMFNFLVSRCSGVYNFFYKFTANTKFVLFKGIMKKRIQKVIQEKKIDIVISTFPICSKYISAYKKINHSNLKLYTYITDVEVSREWLTDETNAYFVASNETKKQMMNDLIPEEKIKVVGIPVRQEFKVRKGEPKKNEVLVMGGGLGLIPSIEKTLKDLSQIEDLHITLLTGKNQKLFDAYHKRYKNITTVGYTNEVYEYVKRAKLIITKAGGITLFEAIHSKTPMYVLDPFLSQEIGNAKFIEKKGIGKVVWNKEIDVTQDILALIRTPERLESMKQNMQKVKDELQTLTVLDVYEKGA